MCRLTWLTENLFVSLVCMAWHFGVGHIGEHESIALKVMIPEGSIK